jgi:TRAP-type C4-dicarboxylate transport system permease small subunit
MDTESRILTKGRASVFLDGLQRVLEYLLASLFIILFLATMLNIALRNLGGIAWVWIPGFTRFTFIWTVFLGIAIAYRRNEHLEVDFFLNSFPSRTRSLILLIVHVTMLVFFVILLYYGLEVAQARMRIPFDTWRVPTGYAYMAVPASAVLLLLFGIERIFALIKELRTL